MVASLTQPLVDAVTTVAEEHGWAGTTAELVAKAAGVNRTTLYRQGYTRENLLAGAAAAAARGFRERSLAPLTAAGTARDRLSLLLGTLYDLADEHLGLLAGLFDGPSAAFHLDRGATDPALTRFEYTEPFERLLRDGDLDGTLASEDPATDAVLVFNTAGWTYIHLRRSHGWAPEAARPAVTRIVLGAFLAPTGSQPDQAR